MVSRKKPASTPPGVKAVRVGSAPHTSTSIGVPEDGIGDRIKEAREAMGLSQVALASRTKLADKHGVGVSRTVIVGYESGAHKPGAREIRIICEALHVTPNWLLYRKETPYEVVQASMDFMRSRSEVVVALRIAIAAMLLKPHERDSIASLIFSLAGRSLGDAKLSGLMAAASMMAGSIQRELSEFVTADNGVNGLTVQQVIDALAGGTSNYGNKLRFDEEGNPVGGEWLYPDPD